MVTGFESSDIIKCHKTIRETTMKKQNVICTITALLTFTLLLFTGCSDIVKNEESNTNQEISKDVSENADIRKAIAEVERLISKGEMEYSTLDISSDGSLKLSRASSPTGVIITPAGPITVSADEVVTLSATATLGANFYVWELYKDGVRTPAMTSFTQVNTHTVNITADNYGSGNYELACTMIIATPAGTFPIPLNSNTISVTFNKQNQNEIGFYRFDGNLRDEKNMGSGTRYGSTIKYETGLNNQALSLNNSGSGDYYVNDYVQLPNSTVSDKFTISLWTKFRSNNNSTYEAALFSMGRCRLEDALMLLVYPNGDANVVIASNFGGSTLNWCATPKKNIDDSQWHHLAVTYANSVLSFYVDNRLVGTKNLKPNQVPNFSGLRQFVGLHEWSTGQYRRSNYNGLIDQLRIFNAALPAGEISRIYASDRR